MPDEPDDDPVRPLKVMRKRLNGVYRADSGFSGPTRRYVLIVALLVGLASVPTLAAITIGSNELADGKTDTMDIPFLPPASPGPIRPQPHWPPVRSPSPSPSLPAVVLPSTLVPSSASVSPSLSPSAVVPPSAAAPSQPPTASPPVPPSAPDPTPGTVAAPRAGRKAGEAGRRRDRGEFSYAGGHAKPSGGWRHPGSGQSSGTSRPSAHAGPASSPDSPDLPSLLPGLVTRPGFPSVPGFPSFPGLDTPPAEPDDPPALPDDPSQPEEPNPSHHHRPDWSRHHQCDKTTRRDRRSHHRAGRTRTVTVHIDPADPHGHRKTTRRQSADALFDELRDRLPDPDRATGGDPERSGPAGRLRQVLRSIVSHRSQDGRSEHSRSSAVTERPQNIRAASTLERGFTNGGYHSRRRIPEARTEENQITNRSYRGNHRADSQHHADDQTPAQQRSSRVGRHHADQQDDHAGRS